MNREKPFKPKPGQIDFTHARWVPIINCVVRHRGKVLLVKRNMGMRLYPGYWNGVSGFLDDKRSIEEKVRDELQEELGLLKKSIKTIRLGAIFNQDAPKYKKTWIVHPVLVDIATDVVRLDWEAEECVWAPPQDIKKYKIMPGFDKVLQAVL